MEKEFSGKTIILGVPNHFGLPERFKENLEFLGFKVFLLEFNRNFEMSVQDTLKHVLKKIFKKEKTYKAQKKAEFFEEQHLVFIENIKEKIDFSLIIRPDLYSRKVIKKIREKALLSTAYQWDGLERFPLAKELIDDFDRFFVFDVRDAEKNPKCLPITNFYFDDLMQETNIKTDVFFVGTFMKERMSLLVNLKKKFNNLKLKSEMYIVTDSQKKKDQFRDSGLIFSKEGMSFKENLIKTKESNVVVDFQNPRHYGISFRAFETLGFKKKLITNNLIIKEMDFYHPKNIFLVNDENIDEIENFLSLPYQNLEENMYEKYSFNNWIKNIFY